MESTGNHRIESARQQIETILEWLGDSIGTSPVIPFHMSINLRSRDITGPVEFVSEDRSILIKWAVSPGPPFCGDIYRLILQESVLLTSIVSSTDDTVQCLSIVIQRSSKVRTSLLTLQSRNLMDSTVCTKTAQTR